MRNESHKLREGSTLQIGDTRVVLRRARNGTASVKVIEPEGRKIQRIDPERPAPVQCAVSQ